MKEFTTILAFSTSCMSFSPLPLLLSGMVFPIKLLDMIPCLILYFPGWGCTQLQDKMFTDLRLFLETMDWSEYKSESAAIAKLVTKSPHPCVQALCNMTFQHFISRVRVHETCFKNRQ